MAQKRESPITDRLNCHGLVVKILIHSLNTDLGVSTTRVTLLTYLPVAANVPFGQALYYICTSGNADG